jgi:hypothetical protein
MSKDARDDLIKSFMEAHLTQQDAIRMAMGEHLPFTHLYGLEGMLATISDQVAQEAMARKKTK